MFGLMPSPPESGRPARRRRSDAQHSIDAILGAARAVLRDRPDASMEEIASAAGVSRQTVYAHFPSREALITALLDLVGAETVAAMDAADLGAVPPVEALRRYLDIGWELIRRNPHLLGAALMRDPPGSSEHEAGVERLEEIIGRGQRSGDFDDAQPASWLAVAIVSLFAAAAAQVAAGRLTPGAATATLLDSALLICGASAASRLHPQADSRRL
jgi:AcrR family transcriptional regulator